jgi:hypothetical protein
LVRVGCIAVLNDSRNGIASKGSIVASDGLVDDFIREFLVGSIRDAPPTVKCAVRALGGAIRPVIAGSNPTLLADVSCGIPKDGIAAGHAIGECSVVVAFVGAVTNI